MGTNHSEVAFFIFQNSIYKNKFYFSLLSLLTFRVSTLLINKLSDGDRWQKWQENWFSKNHLTVCTPKDAQRLPTWGSFYSSVHWKNKVLPQT